MKVVGYIATLPYVDRDKLVGLDLYPDGFGLNDPLREFFLDLPKDVIDALVSKNPCIKKFVEDEKFRKKADGRLVVPILVKLNLMPKEFHLEGVYLPNAEIPIASIPPKIRSEIIRKTLTYSPSRIQGYEQLIRVLAYFNKIPYATLKNSRTSPTSKIGRIEFPTSNGAIRVTTERDLGKVSETFTIHIPVEIAKKIASPEPKYDEIPEALIEARKINPKMGLFVMRIDDGGSVYLKYGTKKTSQHLCTLTEEDFVPNSDALLGVYYDPNKMKVDKAFLFYSTGEFKARIKDLDELPVNESLMTQISLSVLLDEHIQSIESADFLINVYRFADEIPFFDVALQGFQILGVFDSACPLSPFTSKLH